MPFWSVNRESVSADCLEGEVVAIHLGTGIYYSLRGPAAALWLALDRPVDAAALARVLGAQFEVAPEQAERDAGAFLQRLCDEGLVVEVETAVAAAAPEPAGKRRPYTPLVLERFADLQDLLLLDPIHDVGEQGWPHRLPRPENPA